MLVIKEETQRMTFMVKLSNVKKIMTNLNGLTFIKIPAHCSWSFHVELLFEFLELGTEVLDLILRDFCELLLDHNKAGIHVLRLEHQVLPLLRQTVHTLTLCLRVLESTKVKVWVYNLVSS